MGDFGKTKRTANHNKHNASIVKIFGACICVCVAFCIGFALRGNTNLLDAMGLSSLASESQINPGQTVSGNTSDSLSARVAEVEGLLKEESGDSYDLGQATTKVLNAFISAIDDSYMRYYDEQSYQAYLSGTANPAAGVGVLFSEGEDSVFVVDVFEDSSAAASGVQAGDIIESIDGSSVKDKSLPEVLNDLSRDEGTEAYITWRRPAGEENGEEETFGTTLIYSSSTKANVAYSVQDGVGTISLSQIAADSASEVKAALTECKAQQATSFLLDLRDVPGGYLTQAVDIASLFISNGTVVQIETVDGTTTRTAEGEGAFEEPLVVLVNERTAGCAEVLAAALQETERAQLVGTVTQGKGSVQVMQPLSFGGALRYTAAHYLTAKGAQIEGKGITPNIEISNADSQETVAFDVVRSLSTE